MAWNQNCMLNQGWATQSCEGRITARFSFLPGRAENPAGIVLLLICQPLSLCCSDSGDPGRINALPYRLRAVKAGVEAVLWEWQRCKSHKAAALFVQ